MKSDFLLVAAIAAHWQRQEKLKETVKSALRLPTWCPEHHQSTRTLDISKFSKRKKKKKSYGGSMRQAKWRHYQTLACDITRWTDLGGRMNFL